MDGDDFADAFMYAAMDAHSGDATAGARVAEPMAIPVSTAMLQARLEDAESDNTRMAAEVASLSGQLERANKKLALLAQRQVTSGKNISVLYKTARLEIERKDRRIAELEAELDALRMEAAAREPRRPAL